MRPHGTLGPHHRSRLCQTTTGPALTTENTAPVTVFGHRIRRNGYGRYNDAGNITKKTDVCSTTNCYAYPTATSARPHAISSLSGTFNGATNPAFSYDNNGNMTAGAGRSVVYTSFNMSAEMTQGATKLCWTYDADHQRVRMDEVSSCGGSPTSSTYYLNDSVSGLMSEKIVSGSTTTTKDYLQVSGVLVGTRTKVGTGDPSIAYYVVDHLGSIAVTTDEAGVLVCRMTYDPWGKTTATGGSCTAPTRTFTSEESINTGALVNLVNLNARVYDAVLGRFMAADPISNPYAAQSLNLYTYALNSPLAFSDRTGLQPTGCQQIASDEECVEITGPKFRPPGNLGGVLRLGASLGGFNGSGIGDSYIATMMQHHMMFHNVGGNASPTKPAKTRNGTVPKARVPCGFVSLTGGCAIQTGVTELPQVGWSKALRYAQNANAYSQDASNEANPLLQLVAANPADLAKQRAQQLKQNRDAGLEAEERRVDELLALGWSVITHIYFYDPATKLGSIVDIVAWRQVYQNTYYWFEEVKTGDSPLTENQQAMQRAMASGTAIPGPSIAPAGLNPGQPIGEQIPYIQLVPVYMPRK